MWSMWVSMLGESMTTGQQEVGIAHFTSFRISNYFNRV